MFVKKEYRGKGISKSLMELLENRAREQGYHYLILESGEPLTAAMALYKKSGTLLFQTMEHIRICQSPFV